MNSRGKSKPSAQPPASEASVLKTKPHPRGVFRFKTLEEFNTFKAAHHLPGRSPSK